MTSAIKCLSYAEYVQLSSTQVAQILRDQHILVHGVPEASKIEFGQEGLEQLGRMDREMDIQGALPFHAILNDTPISIARLQHPC